MPIVDRDVNGIDELVQEVLKIAAELPHGRFLWFRGLNCSTHTLIPKIMRAGKVADAVFERERRLLTRFRQRSLAYWPSGYPQNDWEHLFAMQHFGMPTRLLDWSENLFVAAHFALTQGEKHTHEGECQCVIWCVDPVQWNRATPALSEFGEVIHVMTTADDELDPYHPNTNRKRQKSPIAIFGTHNSNRIVAQRGTFMVWGSDTRALESVTAEMPESKLWRLKLQGDRAQLSESLRHLGFSETMVFPELPSLGDELTRTEGWKS